MFDNIEGNPWGGWVCWLEEPFEGNNIMYIGEGTEAVTGADEYWD